MLAAHAGNSDASALKERVKIGVIGGELSIRQRLQHTVMHVNHIEHAARQDLLRARLLKTAISIPLPSHTSPINACMR